MTGKEAQVVASLHSTSFHFFLFCIFIQLHSLNPSLLWFFLFLDTVSFPPWNAPFICLRINSSLKAFPNYPSWDQFSSILRSYCLCICFNRSYSNLGCSFMCFPHRWWTTQGQSPSLESQSLYDHIRHMIHNTFGQQNFNWKNMFNKLVNAEVRPVYNNLIFFLPCETAF